MHERFYTSPNYANEKIDHDTPVVFLAGPVQGAPDWQSRFADILLEARPDIIVASPRPKRDDSAHFDADKQVAWEIANRSRAREFGVTAIWFAAQDFTVPYPEGRSYAQTTRIELGETVGWLKAYPNLALVVGFDREYGLKGGGSEGYIRKLLAHYEQPVYDNEGSFVHAILEKLPRD